MTPVQALAIAHGRETALLARAQTLEALVLAAREALADVVDSNAGGWEHDAGHCTRETECCVGHVNRVLDELDAALAPDPFLSPCERCHELFHDHDCPSVGDGRLSEAPPPYSRWLVPSGWRFTNLGHCRTCGAEVAWCRTPAGRPAPVNMDGVSHFATCPQADQHRRPR